MISKAKILEREITKERKVCRCENRMVKDEETGLMTVSLWCTGCHHYDSNPMKCDIRDNTIQALNEVAWEKEYRGDEFNG